MKFGTKNASVGWLFLFWEKKYVLQLLPPNLWLGGLAEVENGDKQFSCSQWESSACTHGGLLFYVLGYGRRGGGFFLFPMCSHCVPHKFPVGPHHVPQVFLKTFTIAPRFYPIFLGHSSTSMYLYAKGNAEGKHISASNLGECTMMRKNGWKPTNVATSN